MTQKFLCKGVGIHRVSEYGCVCVCFQVSWFVSEKRKKNCDRILYEKSSLMKRWYLHIHIKQQQLLLLLLS